MIPVGPVIPVAPVTPAPVGPVGPLGPVGPVAPTVPAWGATRTSVMPRVSTCQTAKSTRPADPRTRFRPYAASCSALIHEPASTEQLTPVLMFGAHDKKTVMGPPVMITTA